MITQYSPVYTGLL